MAEANTQTRVEEVTASIEAVEGKYGEEAYNRIITQCIKDISKSIAMLVDAGTTES